MAVLGAAGGIGQPLSLLLNLSGKFERLSLFDIVNTPGVAADIAHCNTATKVCDVVVAAAVAGAFSVSPTHCPSCWIATPIPRWRALLARTSWVMR